MAKETLAPSRGWGWPGNSKKSHYFIDGRSLCGSWLFFGTLSKNQTTTEKPGLDDCKACHKKLAKEK